MPESCQEVEHLLGADRLGQRQGLMRQDLADRGEQLPPEHGQDHTHGEQKPVAHRLPGPVWRQPATRDQTMQVRMPHQGLTPRVARRDEARLRAQILRVRQQGPERVAHSLKQ
jgi:hypothetical protein